jgi:hypothetical protein
LLHFRIVAQKRKYTNSLNIGRNEEVESVKLEILTGIEVPATERMRMESDGVWSKPRVRCNGIRSG